MLVGPPLGWVVAGLLGALWGSFFNVAIHRLGLYESVMRPRRSRCPRCGAWIGARDNLPIVSWLVLGGRCRTCRARISLRYPLVELLSLGLALGVYARFVPGDEPVTAAARFLVYFAFLGTLLVISFIDFDHRLIPDVIVYPAIPLFFLCGLLVRDVAALDLVIGIVVGYGIVALPVEVIYWISGREVMGYGDAKLLALIGALLGWHAVLFSLFAGAIVGALVLLPLRLIGRERLFGVEVPFGPFLAMGAGIYLFFGARLLALLYP